jgi:ectoine hydroxylase-related dioxygenase (phytanoyl-CoA dioxygenase family)
MRHVSDDELDRLAHDLDRDGVCVLRQLFPPPLIESWASAFKVLFEHRSARPGALAGRDEGRFYSTLPWTEPFADPAVFANPVISGIVERVLGRDFVLVQMGADTPLAGSNFQDVHRDHLPLFSEDHHTPIFALAVNFPLCDVTEHNGPFQMARGTHRTPRSLALARLAAGESALESFLMRAGDVIIRAPIALHRGTPNRTPHPRPMIVLGYVKHWLHTPHLQLKVPRHAYERLPPALRDRLRCEVTDTFQEQEAETYLQFKY